MPPPIRVLLLEDNADDAALIIRELRKTPFDSEVRRVDSEQDFVEGLREFQPEIVLSDHRLAGFSGMHALETVRERAPDTPFIFVTGSLDEETAAECVKAGAWDYVLKDRLVRLAPAVTSALDLRQTREALRRSQEQLLHTQKMDALGRLAGGIAHDYNNLMSAIIGYCFLLGTTIEKDDPRRGDLDEVRRAAERAGALTHQLLAFSRKQVIEFKIVLLNDVITNTERMLKRLIGDRVTIVTALDSRLPAIRSNTSQMEQVLVNLVVNARDAMPTGGHVTIETSSVDIEEAHRARHPDAALGRHALLRVTDTGTGMSPETLAQIFEPFYTTKPRGQGTGLGLATVYGIVRQNHGHITVTSALGEGTVFTIYLPATTLTSVDSTNRPASSGRKLAGTETILVVEDEPTVRTLARRVLASYGYRVLEAGTVAEARDAATRTPRIDLLLTDVVLPDGNGPMAAEMLTAHQPHVRVIFMSGYTDVEIAGADDGKSATPFVQKPFDPMLLVERVREALDG